ncbi:MAG: VOC family protein [Acidimicrobiales bacterium]
MSMQEAALLAKMVLVGADGTVAVTRLVSRRPPDLATVDQVARLVLVARRTHRRVHLERVCPILAALLDLAGVVELTGIRPGQVLFDDFWDTRSSYQPKEGGTMPKAKPTIQVKQVLTVGVPVADQDRALRFYIGTLGCGPRLDVPIGPDKRWIVVAPPTGTATIALEASTKAMPAGVETGIRLTSTDVAGDHAALRADGVDVDDILRWEGVPPMFSFRDPDGNGLELVGEA